VIWNELAKNFTHNYTVLQLGVLQGSCHHAVDRLFGVKVIENKGFLPVSARDRMETQMQGQKTGAARFR
jgi:hypothetical protein